MMTPKPRERRRHVQGGGSTPSDVSRAVPLQWVGVEESPLIFANSMVVQHTEHEFIITFAQVHPPIILGQREKREKDIAAIKSVPARAVVRVVLPPTRLQELVRILEENYQTYLRRISALAKEEEGGKEDV